jgi:hypothetical protein
MLKRLLCAVALMACFSATPTVAEQDSAFFHAKNGTHWYSQCQYHYELCRLTAMTFVRPHLQITQLTGCFPKGVNFEQIVDLFLKEVNDFPAKRHHSETVIFARAVSRAFGCPPVWGTAMKAVIKKHGQPQFRDLLTK